MADARQDLVESIVGEVLRQLCNREHTTSAADASETEQKTRVFEEEANGRLTISERVVTLATIQDRLDSVRQIVLPRGAVVTPSVRDELRRRRVAVAYNCSPSPETSDCGLLVGAAATACDVGPFLKTVELATGRVQQIDAGALPEVLKLLIPPVASGQTLGLLLTGHPAAALCAANRNLGVRAAAGDGARSVAEAVKTIAANLLVVDPASQSTHRVREMVREFTRAGRRECPPPFRQLLEGDGSC